MLGASGSPKATCCSAPAEGGHVPASSWANERLGSLFLEAEERRAEGLGKAHPGLVPLSSAPFLSPGPQSPRHAGRGLKQKPLPTRDFPLWSGGDSNSRPLPCEGSALPAELPPLGGSHCSDGSRRPSRCARADSPSARWGTNVPRGGTKVPELASVQVAQREVGDKRSTGRDESPRPRVGAHPPTPPNLRAGPATPPRLPGPARP